MTDYLQFLIAGLTMGAVYALVGLGYHIIIRATRAINFAQGDQVVMGGLIALTFINGAKFPLFIAVVLSLVIGGVIGLAYERLALRPTYKTGQISTVIASIGVSLFFFHGQGLVWGKEAQAFPPFTGGQNDVVNVLGAKVLVQSLWAFGLLALSLIVLNLFFERTIYGKAMQAAATNELGAQLSGISPNRMKAYSVGLASALASLAGVMIAPFTLAGGALAMPIGIKGFAGAMVGGLGSPIGVVAGGLIVGVVESFAAGLLASGYRDPVAFSLLLLVLLFRPSGLFGSESKSRG